MKKPKLRKPNLKKIKLPRVRRKKTVEEKLSDAISTVPKITNDTVTEHREDVLSGARKYIYPLRHSKHHIVRTSLLIFFTVLIIFFVICGISLYKLQTTSGFFYSITKVIPFPVAKSDGTYIKYESYLFELRRNLHYYKTQQGASFTNTSGKSQLKRLKQLSLNQAITNSLANNLAKKDGVIVSSNEVNNQLKLLKQQNKLGSSDQVFKEVLSQYYGWSINDFKRELANQLTQQDLAIKLDKKATEKAQNIQSKLSSGADYATIAKQYSDDNTTKDNGGNYAFVINPTSQLLSPIVVHTLFTLKTGQISNLVKNDYKIEILKVIDKQNDSLHAAHIQIDVKSINQDLNKLQKNNTHAYIKI